MNRIIVIYLVLVLLFSFWLCGLRCGCLPAPTGGR